MMVALTHTHTHTFEYRELGVHHEHDRSKMWFDGCVQTFNVE